MTLALLSLTLLAAFGTAAPPDPAAAPTPAAGRDAAQVIVLLQQRYEGMRGVAIEFTQRYTNRATGRVVEESGRLFARKPGRMRWEYRDPEKLFVLRDGVSWFHVPDEQVAYRLQSGPDARRRIPALLLAGEARLAEDFTPTLESSETEERLKLVPRKSGEEYEYVVLRLDPATLALRALQVVDILGNLTEYEFRAEEVNADLPERLFVFEPPADAEIVVGN